MFRNLSCTSTAARRPPYENENALARVRREFAMEKKQSIAYKADHTVINAHKHLRLSCNNFFKNIVPKAELTLMLTMRELVDEKGEK